TPASELLANRAVEEIEEHPANPLGCFLPFLTPVPPILRSLREQTGDNAARLSVEIPTLPEQLGSDSSELLCGHRLHARRESRDLAGLLPSEFSGGHIFRRASHARLFKASLRTGVDIAHRSPRACSRLRHRGSIPPEERRP